MNRRDRFMNVVQGKPVDRRPFGALLSLYGAGLTGCPLERYFNDAAEYARGQSAVAEQVAPDLLFGPFILAGYGEAFGGTLRYVDRYVPSLLRPALASIEDLPRLSVPDVDANPRLLFIRDSIRRIKAAHGPDFIVVGIVLNPLDLPLVILGVENWLLAVLSDETATRKMLDVTIPFFIRWCRTLLQDGADVLAMPMSFLTRAITTRSIVQSFALPALRTALSGVDGPVVFHHTGSTFFEYLDLLAGLPAVAGFTMDVRDDLGRARSLVKPEHLLFGGFDGPYLHTLSPGAIRTRCIELLVRSKDDSRYLPFATGTDVELQTPVDRLIAIRQAVEEYGNG